MTSGLSRDEDTALRCLAALTEAGHQLTQEQAELLSSLLEHDRRGTIRRTGTVVPHPREAESAEQHAGVE